MRERISKFLKKLSLVGVSAAGAVTLVISGSVGFPTVVPQLQPATAVAASSCPQDDVPETNILYCGVDGGSNLLQALQSFQNYYNANSDAHSGNPATHTDIQQIYNAIYFQQTGSKAGISTLFNSGTWFIGTAYDAATSPVKDHTSIVVSGNVVATDIQISSRCPSMTPESGYCQPPSAYPALTGADGKPVTNVHTRDGNWFFLKDGNGNLIHSEQTLVHMTNGVADFALWTPCGNALTFKPYVQSLVCKQLDYKLDSQDDSSFVYTFTVTATVQNVSNITYKIDYGDSATETKSVTNGQSTMSFGPHTYTRLDTDKTYTIKAIVNSQPQVEACQKSITIPAKQKLTFACLQLTSSLDSSSTATDQIYNFVGKVQGTDTAASYKFTFTNADGSQSTVAVNPDSGNPQMSVPVKHEYAIDTSKDQSFSASFVATSKTGLTFATTSACQFNGSTTHGPLPKTGPEGTVGIFAGVSTIGAALHQIVLRRKAKAVL